MKELQEKLIRNLKGYSFEEMLEMLNKQTEPVVKGTILDAMEKYHEEKFLSWIA